MILLDYIYDFKNLFVLRLDSHQHFWQYNPEKHTWINNEMSVLKKDYLPEDLQGELAATNIDGTIAVQAEQSEDETAFLTRLADKNPIIKGVVGWTDLFSDYLPEKLDEYRKYPVIKGFRHVVHDEPDDDFMLQPGFIRGIKVLKVYHYTYDILIFARHIPNTIEFIENLPGVKLVIDHIGKPMIRNQEIKEWERGIREIAQCKDVYCKLSGMITEARWNSWNKEDIYPYMDVVFDAFGTERIMYGSDWPVCLLAGEYVKVHGLVNDYIALYYPETQDRIMGKNAMKFYNID